MTPVSEHNGDQDITRMIRAAHDGDRAAFDQLVPRVYADLRRLASQLLKTERANHTLQPTALVNEAWLKLARQDSLGFEHRGQFFAAAATAMRRILVDHARARKTQKRGGGETSQSLDQFVDALEAQGADLVELEEALKELATRHERPARLVELRFFLGLGVREAAEILAVSVREAERDWTLARAWLRRQLGPPE